MSDEHRLLPRFRLFVEEARVARRARASGGQLPRSGARVANGDVRAGASELDWQRLRGIPAVGRQVGGAIAGTVPGRSRELDEWIASSVGYDEETDGR